MAVLVPGPTPVATIGRRRVQWAGYLCFLPAITLTAVFKLYPLAFGVFYASPTGGAVRTGSSSA